MTKGYWRQVEKSESIRENVANAREEKKKERKKREHVQRKNQARGRNNPKKNKLKFNEFPRRQATGVKKISVRSALYPKWVNQ
jgi:hypothetical protein